jgi:uncharacterized protein involved in propanediol utilization
MRIARVAGHFGELIQGRLGPGGPVVLITLPCPVLAAEAVWRPGHFALHQPGARVATPGIVAALLVRLGVPRRGRFSLRLAMMPGGGAGASSAALMALARAAGVEDVDAITRACLAIEGATDPLLFPAPERVLWASRLGEARAAMPPLPRMEILGGFRGPGVATDPADNNFPDVADLVATWPAACGDAAGVARLAQMSAERTLAVRGPRDDPTAELARSFGALGWAMAHTGAARALIFRPGTAPEAAVADLRAAGFCSITRFRIGGGT